MESAHTFLTSSQLTKGGHKTETLVGRILEFAPARKTESRWKCELKYPSVQQAHIRLNKS